MEEENKTVRLSTIKEHVLMSEDMVAVTKEASLVTSFE